MAAKNEKNRFARLSDWTIHMQVRQLGNTDLNFTTLVLGTWAIGAGV